MIEIQGKYNTAKVFTDYLEKEALAQILELCNQEFTAGSSIRIMPDTHAGAGCTIGTTMTVSDRIVPNLVGVDIGCGMETVRLKDRRMELSKLDKMIHQFIPAGFDVRSKAHDYAGRINLEALACRKQVNLQRAVLSVGTLGGGNHFIEVNRNEEGVLYLVVHSGSRNLGKQVAEYYQKLGAEELKGTGINRQLAYVQGKNFEDYLTDMRIVQQYALYNRKAIVDEIVRRMDLDVEDQFSTIHNYIDLDGMILRKGAISAREGEKVLIPINMRDGSLLCIGKGNPDWNWSAPHGAGRLMSRSKAKETISMEEFRQSMEGIYTSTVNRSTLDECALAYKPMDEIIRNIADTVEITEFLKPIYNFKAAE